MIFPTTFLNWRKFGFSFKNLKFLKLIILLQKKNYFGKKVVSDLVLKLNAIWYHFQQVETTMVETEKVNLFNLFRFL